MRARGRPGARNCAQNDAKRRKWDWLGFVRIAMIGEYCAVLRMTTWHAVDVGKEQQNLLMMAELVARQRWAGFDAARGE